MCSQTIQTCIARLLRKAERCEDQANAVQSSNGDDYTRWLARMGAYTIAADTCRAVLNGEPEGDAL